MRLSTPRIIQRGSQNFRWEVDIEINHPRIEAFQLYFDVYGAMAVPSMGDCTAAFAACYLPAAALQQDLGVGNYISHRLSRSLLDIEKIYMAWVDLNYAPQVMYSAAPMAYKGYRGIGVPFSCGVDGTFTAHRLAQEGSAHHMPLYLINIRGFDVPLDNGMVALQVSEHTAAVAASLKAKVITVETNLRNFTDPIVAWNVMHGSALAAVGHLLQETISEFYISSSHTYKFLHPWGTSPTLDHLWSTELMEVIHYGAAFTRLEKLEYLRKIPQGLDHLKVCTRKRTNALNCGQCEKCIRTMIGLWKLNVLEHSKTFPYRQFCSDQIYATRWDTDQEGSGWVEMIHALDRKVPHEDNMARMMYDVQAAAHLWTAERAKEPPIYNPPSVYFRQNR